MSTHDGRPAPWVIRPNWRNVVFPKLTLAEQSLFREAAAAKVRHYVERLSAGGDAALPNPLPEADKQVKQG